MVSSSKECSAEPGRFFGSTLWNSIVVILLSNDLSLWRLSLASRPISQRQRLIGLHMIHLWLLSLDSTVVGHCRRDVIPVDVHWLFLISVVVIHVSASPLLIILDLVHHPSGPSILILAVSQPVIGCARIEAQLSSHVAPRLIKLACVILPHVLVVVVAVHLVAHFLLDYLPALVI